MLEDGDGLALELEAVAERDVDEAVYRLHDQELERYAGAWHQLTSRRGSRVTASRGRSCPHHLARAHVFSDGLHQIEVAITDRQGLTVYDWWQDAASFTVVKEEKTPTESTPDAQFSFQRLDK